MSNTIESSAFFVTGRNWNGVITDPAFKQANDAWIEVKVIPEDWRTPYYGAFRSDGSLICSLTPSESRSLKSQSVNALGVRLQQSIDAVAAMFDAYRAEHDRPIGADGYGSDYAAQILNSLHAMLNFDVRGIDCGDASKRIHAIAGEHELLDANGEISG